MRDPDLLAAQDVLITSKLGARLDRGRIGARLRLGQCKCPEQLSARHCRKVFALLRFVSELVENQLRQPMYRQYASEVSAEARELFKHNRVAGVVEASAAILGWKRNRSEAKLAQFAKERPREILAGCLLVRLYLARDEIFHKPPQLLLFFG